MALPDHSRDVVLQGARRAFCCEALLATSALTLDLTLYKLPVFAGGVGGHKGVCCIASCATAPTLMVAFRSVRCIL